MAFCTLQFDGASIGKKSSMNLIIPETKGSWPVLVLLHGLSDDHTIWSRRTAIERYVEGTGLLVAMPDGHRSWYVNDPRPGGMAYEDHIIKDVLGFIDRTFPTVGTRDGRAIAGLSMGGYGATMLALKHPNRFSVACGHSSAVGLVHARQTSDPRWKDLLLALPKEDYDVFTLAGKVKAGRRKVALRLDCGVDDFLLEGNRAFHAHLTKIGLPHVYEEYPGAHTWDYWDEHIQQSLAFIRANLPCLQAKRRRTK